MSSNPERHLQVGNYVRGVIAPGSAKTGATVAEGTVVFIHPRNGWITMAIDYVFRPAINDRGRAASGVVCYKVATPYRESFWIDDVTPIECRISAKEDIA